VTSCHPHPGQLKKIRGGNPISTEESSNRSFPHLTACLRGKARLTVLATLLFSTLIPGQAFALATIKIISVPAYGNFGSMSGVVSGVDCSQYRVAGVIYVPGLGWYTKPFFSDPSVAINPTDCTWSLNVTTGGLDTRATIHSAWLVPANFTVPLASGSGRVPAALSGFPHDSRERYGPIVEFAGRRWAVKDAPLPVGPGANLFSALPTDVWADQAGLHLTLSKKGDDWWSTELTLLGAPLGYGTYIYQTASRTDNLDINVTFGGGFTWDDYGDEESPDGSANREIDIGEDSRWGVPADANTQNVKQPYNYTAANRYRFNLPDLSGDPALTRIMVWTPTFIRFITLKGNHPTVDDPSAVVSDYTYTHNPSERRYVPVPGRERLHFNLWLNKTVNSTGPTDGQPIEVIVKNFAFSPLNNQRDLDGSGTSDLIWSNTATKETAAWLMDGLNPISARILRGFNTGWSVEKIADLNGDGKADIVWRHSDGTLASRLMNGLDMLGEGVLLGPGSGWSIKLVGDFDGNGKDDLLWEHTDGSSAIWLMDGLSPIAGGGLLGPGTAWRVKLIGDFDGNGKDDLLWEHADGSSAIWLMDGLSPIAGGGLLGPGTAWRVKLIGDFDGNGKDDLLWEHADGSSAIWLMNGLTAVAGGGLLGPGTGWSAKHIGDFDGNGKDDIVWEHADGSWAIWLMNGLPPLAGGGLLGPGTGWSVTHIGDFESNGKADLLWEHLDGSVVIWLMDGLSASKFGGVLGPGTGWKPVP